MSFIKIVEELRKIEERKNKKIGISKEKTKKVKVKNVKKVPEQRKILSTPPINYTHIFETNKGKLIVDENSRKISIVDYDRDSILYPLTPLFYSKDVSEIFVRNNSVVVTFRNRRYFVNTELNINELLENIAISQGVILNLSKPYAETYLTLNGSEWRIYLKLNEKEILCAKIIQIPSLLDFMDKDMAIKVIMLLLKPSGLVICGPTGSGKTTLMNSIINTVLKLFELKISVIEQVKELVLPETPLISRSIASDKWKVTDLLRNAIRYERPSIIVLGELRTEEIESWFEISKGLASITTFHSTSLKSTLDVFKLYISKYTGIQYRPEFTYIFMEKIKREKSVVRRVKSIYTTLNNGIVELDKVDVRNNTMVGDYNTVYNLLSKRLDRIIHFI
ncbi:MAG TPA: hypothetical protein ENG40_00810 [Thermoprotei archaeon]|nr:MAG: hypothetical protein DRJ34_04615 [Thermoprotei archaeon]HDJ89220.1 hypothetical protein [Thermoprotei archaeon]